MKVPAVIRTYCPRCNAHTEHVTRIFKRRRPRNLSWGQRQMEKLERGYGSSPRGRLRRPAKTTKKQVVMLKCKVCGYTIVRKGIRISKLEIAR